MGFPPWLGLHGVGVQGNLTVVLSKGPGPKPAEHGPPELQRQRS